MKYILIIIVGAGLFGCTIKPPEVQLTGEKTALERQILGTYHEISDEAWMIASVRSSEFETKIEQKSPISEEKQRVLEAIQNQNFNQDDIDEFKRKGCVGENNQGYLEILLCEDAEQNPQYNRLIQEVVAEENRDREIIMYRVIEVNPDLSEDDMEKVRQIFVDRNHQNAKPGEWIQMDDGTWVQKK